MSLRAMIISNNTFLLKASSSHQLKCYINAKYPLLVCKVNPIPGRDWVIDDVDLKRSRGENLRHYPYSKARLTLSSADRPQFPPSDWQRQKSLILHSFGQGVWDICPTCMHQQWRYKLIGHRWKVFQPGIGITAEWCAPPPVCSSNVTFENLSYKSHKGSQRCNSKLCCGCFFFFLNNARKEHNSVVNHKRIYYLMQWI